MSIYDTLNNQQQEAVFHTAGPVLILAGAGSGKTRVITHRIAWLIDECGVNPWNILAITFTNKAAGEMRERVDKLVGFGSESIWVSTFHSMCARILRRYIDRIGYDTSFAIYDTDDQKTVIKDILKKLGVDPKEMAPRAVLSAISSAKNELVTPLRYREDTARDYRERVIGEVYEEYQKALAGNNALDFDDLLMKTVELFQAHEEILEGYQERFRYIMVDEYQDTNAAQFEIVRMLAAKYRNLCVVGDDDQSIYKFRGADIRNILDFEKVYKDALVVKLEQNYRSTQNILDAANAVISHNSGRKDKKLWTDHGSGNRIHLRQFNTGTEEASFIAQDIDRHLKEDHRLNYGDFAVLYRTNAQSRLIEDQLVQNSIPYNIVGGHNFYDRMEVRDILSYLRTINNARDDINTLRILNVPKRGIGRTTQDRILQFAQEENVSFFDALEQMDRIPEIGRARSHLKPFVELIHTLRAFAAENSVEDLIKQVVKLTDYENYLREYDDENGEDRIANVDELISKAASYEEEALENEEEGGTSLSGFLEEVSLVADIDQVDESTPRVLLMTLHSAKGLEFPYVYLAGMEDGIFPGYLSINSDDPDAIEEERRLCYVGITRAKQDLTLTCARARMIRGEVQYNAVSRFVLEIPEKLLDESPRQNGGSYGEDGEDEMPFADPDGGFASFGSGRASSDSYDYGRPYGGRSRYVSRGKESTAGRTYHGSGNSAYTGTGYGSTSYPGMSERNGGRKAPDTRLKASYTPPHTSADKKPYIAKAGLAGLTKGMPAGSAPDYTVGDRVRHIKYGDGVVESIEKGPKDYKVKVSFDEAGTKIMYAAFARLEKLDG